MTDGSGGFRFDGLAAGKGVTVPDGDEATEAAIRATAELGPFVLEERLSGPEFSLLALCDGNVRQAAVFLGIAPATIYRKLKAWQKASGDDRAGNA